MTRWVRLADALLKWHLVRSSCGLLYFARSYSILLLNTRCFYSRFSLEALTRYLKAILDVLFNALTRRSYSTLLFDALTQCLSAACLSSLCFTFPPRPVSRLVNNIDRICASSSERKQTLMNLLDCCSRFFLIWINVNNLWINAKRQRRSLWIFPYAGSPACQTLQLRLSLMLQ